MNKYSTLIFTCLSLILSAGCTDTGDAFHITDWSVAAGNSKTIEEMASSTWKKVSLPYIVKPEIDPRRETCRKHLSAKFSLAKNPEFYHGLFIEGISSFEKVIVNGTEIGSREAFEYNTMFISRSYRIPRGILRKGDNRIDISIGILNRENGGISGDVLLLPKRAFIKKRIFSQMIFSQIPIGIIFLDAGFIILLSLFYILNRKEKQSLFCAFSLFLYVIYLATLFSPFKVLPVTITFAIQLVISITLPFMLIIIYQAFYGIYLSTFNRISSILTLLLAGLLFTAALFSMDYRILRTIHVISIIYLGAVYIYTISQLNSFQRDPFLFKFVIFISAIALLMVCVEVVTALAGGIYSELFTVYISPVYIISFSLLYSKYMTRKEVELQLTYQRLEALNKEKENGTASITDTAEKKLRQVIRFLKENYTSDISREGLAHAIEMNPNYMSRIFKQYTGMKISEYINKLRIEDAVKQLTASNKKIIDIALSTGFESLATFNRVFKTLTGKTPSHYRESKK